MTKFNFNWSLFDGEGGEGNASSGSQSGLGAEADKFLASLGGGERTDNNDTTESPETRRNRITARLSLEVRKKLAPRKSLRSLSERTADSMSFTAKRYRTLSTTDSRINPVHRRELTATRTH